MKNICKAWYFRIRSLRHIRLSLTDNMSNSIAFSLVQSHLDYANTLNAGKSFINFDKLKQLQNILARGVTYIGKRDRIHQHSIILTDYGPSPFGIQTVASYVQDSSLGWTFTSSFTTGWIQFSKIAEIFWQTFTCCAGCKYFQTNIVKLNIENSKQFCRCNVICL